MNAYKNICFFFSMLIFSSVAYAQKASKTYFHPSEAFHIDSIFTPISRGMMSNNPASHLWLNTLNSQYNDTAKNHVNANAVPAFHEIKNNSLFGPHNINKQMQAGMYYHPFFSQSMQYNRMPYDASRPYSALPYGYSPFSIKATASPYYIMPKF